jgi:PAS domain-containing protein
MIDEIRGSEAQIRRVIDTIPAIAWCNSADGSKEFLNKRWHDYTGLTREESRRSGWQTTIHPQDLPRMMNRWQEALASGQSGAVEVRSCTSQAIESFGAGLYPRQLRSNRAVAHRLRTLRT